MRLFLSNALIGATALLAACDTTAPVPVDTGGLYDDPWADPSYPPRLGTMSAVIGDSQASWTTFDFSVGAFDASAWFSRSYEPDAGPGETTLTLVGYPNENPRAENGLLRVVLRLDGRPEAGVRVIGATLELIDNRDFAAPRLAGTGSGSLTRADIGQGSGYGEAAGQFDGRLCPPDDPDGACLSVTGSFTTTVQYDGL